jgi:hypothetical protein
VDAFEAPEGDAPDAPAGVLNLYAQVHPGKPGTYDPADSARARLELFDRCLDSIRGSILRGALGDCEKGIAFPWRIGCALAGGDWAVYRARLEAFALSVPCPVYLVKREEDRI